MKQPQAARMAATSFREVYLCASAAGLLLAACIHNQLDESCALHDPEIIADLAGSFVGCGLCKAPNLM